MKKLFIVAGLALALTQTAFSGVGGIGLHQIQRISIVKTTALEHRSSDVIKINTLEGFTLPTGAAYSDNTYIETPKSSDAARALSKLFRDAKTQKRNVLLHITDDWTKHFKPRQSSVST